ncbi:MAG: TolC family outer membrane protein [Arenimonas sp.]
MRLHPLALALLLTGISAQSQATDLLQAYDLARQSDPQLSAAESQKNAQGEGVVQSRAALLPQLSAEASLTKSTGDSSSVDSNPDGSGGVTFGPSEGSSDTKTRNYGLTLRQSIYDHSNYSRLGASKFRASQAEADLDAASDALVVRTADAYFNVLTAIETLASSRAEERSVKRQLDQAEKRLEVGLAPITDVHEARARYDSARANAITAANTLDDAREALAEITGQPIENIRGLAPTYQPENNDVRTVEEWVSIALESNPSLQSKQKALAAAEKDIQTARAAHYPTLSATASYSDRTTWGTRSSDTFTFPADSINTGSSVGITLSVPIFSGFATQSRVRQSIDQRDIAADQLEQQKRSITRQTRNAYRSLIAGLSEVEARRSAVVSAKAAYEAGEAGLEVGTRTIVDVLIAQQQLYTAQREYARARHAFLVNTLRLRQAAGVLELSDVQAANRSLTVDAEALLINN